MKPANVSNCPLTLNEQKKKNGDDTSNPDIDSIVIEDCHIQTTDSSYGDWLIQQGIPNAQDIKLDPLVVPGEMKDETSKLDIRKIKENVDVKLGPLEKVKALVPGGCEFLIQLGDYQLSNDDIAQSQKRIQHLKNIIWLIENKPTMEMPTDNSNFDMDDPKDSGIEKPQDLSEKKEDVNKGEVLNKEKKAETQIAIGNTGTDVADENKAVDKGTIDKIDAKDDTQIATENKGSDKKTKW